MRLLPLFESQDEGGAILLRRYWSKLRSYSLLAEELLVNAEVFDVNVTAQLRVEQQGIV